MALPGRTRTRILGALKRRGARCAACSKQQFDVADGQVGLPGLEKDGLQLDRFLPVVAVVCAACGHLMLLHAGRWPDEG
jgi:Zn ribbon nucleic-acid-binding protein